MRGRPKLDGHVQMSVLIPGSVYRDLHLLRVTRSSCGARLPSVGQLVREALEQFLGTADDQAGTSVAKAVR
jgi:hypothetical protein